MVDVDAVLAGAATEPTNKKKSKVPTMTVTDPEVVKAITGWKQAKKDKSTAEARQKMLGEDHLVPAAREFHGQHIAGGVTSVPTTVKLQTDDGDAVDIDVAKNQYSKVPVSAEPDLKKQFGDDYESFFAKKLDIKLTPTAVGDKEILAKLIQAVGQENFAKYFKVEHILVPTDAFHTARFTTDSDKAGEVIDEGIVKPYSPAIRG